MAPLDDPEAAARAAAEKKAAEDAARKAAAEKKAAEDAARKVAAETVAAEEAARKVAAETVAAEEAARKVAAETVAAEETARKVAAETVAAEKAARKVAAETVAAEKAARKVRAGAAGCGTSTCGAPQANTQTPAAAFAAEARKIENLVQGSVAFSAPRKANGAFSVYLRVSRSNVDDLIKELQREVPENRVDGKGNVKLTSRMTAAVFGDGFILDPQGDQTKGIGAVGSHTWQWVVKPTANGSVKLNFQLSVNVAIEGKDTKADSYQSPHTVEIPFDLIAFVEKHWPWIASSIAIPIAVAIWKSLWATLRRRNDLPKQPYQSFAKKIQCVRKTKRTV